MLVILADDLTGALDCAAPFAGRGLHTEIALGPESIGLALQATPAVLSVNLGSREVEAEAARQAVAAALSSLPPDIVLFKKIDSRLKGNIAAELDATPFRLALVAPAIPDFGRNVRTGHVEGFGLDKPLNVADALGVHAQHAIIPDTLSQADMFDALEIGREAGADLLVGARGLAEALACHMTGRQNAEPAFPKPGPALFVIGSRDPITLAQIEELLRSLAPDYIAAPNGRPERVVPPQHSVTLVQATPGEKDDPPLLVSDRLAASIVPEMTAPAATLLLSGGTTAHAVLKAMNVSRFQLLGECLPGLGLAYIDGQCIIAKSGGFGTQGTLSEIARAAMGEKG
ncbi:type III effector Hrp-dependent outer protein [Rhizobium sp. CF080]|uniref:four-carbon acid sugar kinase family protein n=1 Tax=Rhizobium sp. (strain CF080) TaxID=1144310 RepID=UPI0003E7E84A|nr:four-carbon acid sugar kinase family protein [Rhizobium sp. CF080]EUB98602.1 type III effector Hrp-dependent outer protein [Rhizobium sp. CF080]